MTTAPRELAAVHCRSASVIEERIQELATSHPGQCAEDGAMYPSSVLMRAFSVELALKSLCYSEAGAWRTGHDLEELFHHLTQESQNWIEQATKPHLDRPLTDVISEIKLLFYEWRYIHDKLGTGASRGFHTNELKYLAQGALQVLDARINSTV